ncbi:MAG: Alpha-galactosidase [Frankiales bacterium]|nr:Alpha-galactosidase [Frankiales bacterium]
MRRLALAVAGIAFAAGLPAQAAVRAAPVSLGNELVGRTWVGGTTTALVDRRTGRNWIVGASDDALLPGDWTYASADVHAREVVLHYTGADGSALVQDVVLRPHSAVFETTTTVTAGLAPLRLAAWTLDAVSVPGTVEVQTYHGGSDWRDDYRVTSSHTGEFDVEGEVARTDDGHGAGVFLVSERRSGVASRAYRTQSTVGVGVDQRHDAFDFGPLRSSPPDYNRLDNPAYPVPVRARTVLPGASLRLGRAFTGVYSGGAQEAGVAFAEDFARATPAYRRTIGLNSFHPWNHGAGMSDANLRRQALLAKKLGVETFMLDDQWQGGAGGESGDWHFDPARFPDEDRDGVPDFVRWLHGQRMTLGLWMSLVEFNKDSTTYKQHPDWVCAPTGIITSQVEDDAGLGVWDATNPQLQAYLLGTVDRLVNTYDVRELKLDFQSWVDCGSHDYLDYEDAFLAMVREIERRHPHLTVELDETNDQRAWPFESAVLGPSWFDNGHLHGSTKTAKELHDLWVAAPWLPTSSIGFGLLDGTLDVSHPASYLAPLGILSHVTFWTDQTKIPVAQRPELAWWLRWYRAHRTDVAGAAYELTAKDPLDGSSPMVLEPWNGDHGLVFAFFQKTGSVGVHVHGVRPATRYRLTDARTGRVVRTATGVQLAHLTLSGKASTAQVLTVTPL